MRRFAATLLVFSASLFSACNYYLDDPPTRTISGTVLIAATGEPLSGAAISFLSGRKVNPYHFPPWETFGVDATAATDRRGHFLVQAKLNSEIRVLVGDNEYRQEFKINGFPESNTIEGIIWSVSQKEPAPKAK